MQDREPDTRENIGKQPFAVALREHLSRLRVPRHRHSLWYHFTGLSLFLLVLVAVTGILLSMYYVPSATPAQDGTGRPLVTVRALQTVEWNGHNYNAGELLAVPYDEANNEPDIPSALRQSVEVVENSQTGKPVSPGEAWVSIHQRIMREARFGWLVRSIHGYASSMLVASLLIQLLSSFFLGFYRSPRRAVWVTGVLLLLLVLAAGYTGSVLPWDTHAWAAAQIGLSIPESGIPGIGSWIADVFRAGGEVSTLTLMRMYSLHVTVLPVLIILAACLLFVLMNIYGPAKPVKEKKGEGNGVAIAVGTAAVLLLIGYGIFGDTFDATSAFVVFPLTIIPVVLASIGGETVSGKAINNQLALLYGNHLYRDFLCWLLVIGGILTLGMLVPYGTQAAGSSFPVDSEQPVLVPEGVQPVWYFMPLYYLVRIFPGGLVMAVVIVAGVFFLGVPFLNRKAEDVGASSLVIKGIGVLLALLLLGCGIAGYAGW